MATIDSNGVLFYQDTDSFTPPASLNLAQSNLSSLLGESPRFKKVANTTARTALVSSVGLANITPANPLLVWRADAAAGSQLEYTTNGTTWRTLADKEYYDAQAAAQDTGWQPVSLASGITGQLRYRRVGMQVEVQCNVTNAAGFPQGATQINATPLPAEVRPSGNRRGGLGLSGSNTGATGVSATGAVFVIHQSGAARTAADGSCIYFLD